MVFLAVRSCTWWWCSTKAANEVPQAADHCWLWLWLFPSGSLFSVRSCGPDQLTNHPASAAEGYLKYYQLPAAAGIQWLVWMLHPQCAQKSLQHVSAWRSDNLFLRLLTKMERSQVGRMLGIARETTCSQKYIHRNSCISYMYIRLWVRGAHVRWVKNFLFTANPSRNDFLFDFKWILDADNSRIL